MTDIFFSYRSVDRERVRPVRDAFAAQGFDVFWDQEVPAGVDWDGWIRQHLAQARCAVVFWSASSAASDNVRHEATIARHHGKLIPVLLEPLAVDQFPMGLYSQQAANLAGWAGDQAHAEWRKLRREVEAKLMPAWVQNKVGELEAELVAERSRREAAERRDGALQARIATEAEKQLDLKRERDQARQDCDEREQECEQLRQEFAAQLAALKAEVDELHEANAALGVANAELQRERDHALEQAVRATLEQRGPRPADRLGNQKHAEARNVALAPPPAAAPSAPLPNFLVRPPRR